MTKYTLVNYEYAKCKCCNRGESGIVTTDSDFLKSRLTPSQIEMVKFLRLGETITFDDLTLKCTFEDWDDDDDNV